MAVQSTEAAEGREVRTERGVIVGFGGFIIFLGSAQPVIGTIYGRANQFSLWFALASIVVAVSFFSVSRFINRYGAHRVAVADAAHPNVLLVGAATARGSGRVGSGVIGFVGTAGGSVLAAIVGSLIDGTVIPWALGYVAYVGVCVGWLFWAARGGPDAVNFG